MAATGGFQSPDKHGETLVQMPPHGVASPAQVQQPQQFHAALVAGPSAQAYDRGCQTCTWIALVVMVFVALVMLWGASSATRKGVMHFRFATTNEEGRLGYVSWERESANTRGSLDDLGLKGVGRFYGFAVHFGWICLVFSLVLLVMVASRRYPSGARSLLHVGLALIYPVWFFTFVATTTYTGTADKNADDASTNLGRIAKAGSLEGSYGPALVFIANILFLAISIIHCTLCCCGKQCLPASRSEVLAPAVYAQQGNPGYIMQMQPAAVPAPVQVQPVAYTQPAPYT